MSARPPIVGAALWTAVMNASDYRCGCRGACGKKHDPDRKRTQGRCDITDGHYVSKRGRITLIAMPRDPISEGDFVKAASLPPRRLIAMCPECHDAVLRKIRRVAKTLPAQDDGLFAVEEYVVSKASTKQADVGAA